jgi:hypothetical protein
VTGDVEIVEVRHEVGDFGQLGDVDLATADQIEDDFTELGESVAATVGAVETRANVVETGATFARGSLDRVPEGISQSISERADLGCRGPQEGTEGATEGQLGRFEATASSLPCHASKYTVGGL